MSYWIRNKHLIGPFCCHSVDMAKWRLELVLCLWVCLFISRIDLYFDSVKHVKRSLECRKWISSLDISVCIKYILSFLSSSLQVCCSGSCVGCTLSYSLDPSNVSTLMHNGHTVHLCYEVEFSLLSHDRNVIEFLGEQIKGSRCDRPLHVSLRLNVYCPHMSCQCGIREV